MIEVYCPKCESFTPLLIDQPYAWQGTDRFARNLSSAHALQKMAELAFYASPTLPSTTAQPTAKPTRSGKRTRRFRLIP